MLHLLLYIYCLMKKMQSIHFAPNSNTNPLKGGRLKDSGNLIKKI